MYIYICIYVRNLRDESTPHSACRAIGQFFLIGIFYIFQQTIFTFTSTSSLLNSVGCSMPPFICSSYKAAQFPLFAKCWFVSLSWWQVWIVWPEFTMFETMLFSHLYLKCWSGKWVGMKENESSVASSPLLHACFAFLHSTAKMIWLKALHRRRLKRKTIYAVNLIYRLRHTVALCRWSLR